MEGQMISQKIQDEMNQQIMHEMYSAYLYLAMSSHCEQSNLPGFAKWLRMQADEEMEHAMKFYDFIHERQGKVTLYAIDQPPTEFGAPLAIFEQVYEHEQKVTARIHHIYKLALEENDYPSQVFLHWFINEQVEEEANSSQILDTLRLIGESNNGIFMLDHRLSKREED
jgi:ferritin